MSWKLVEVPFPFPEGNGMSERKPGDCWRIPLSHRMSDGETYEESLGSTISPEFRASGRDYLIWIMCPAGAIWCPDRVASNMNGRGWTVTGEFPNITANPSIGALDYHGWLRDGVLSDDLEGRTYS